MHSRARWSWIRLALVVLSVVATPGFVGAQEVCHDQWAAWAPDGEGIVFVSTRTGDHEVYTVSRSTGALRQLTDTPGRDAHPSFSPDGRLVAFQSPRGGTDTHLYLMRPDGSDVRRVTDLPGFAGMPVWSPDGGRLAFQQRAPAPGSRWRLMVVDLSDGSTRALTDGSANDQVVNWSPTDDRLLFHSDRSGINQVHLFDDGMVRALTVGPIEHKNAAWAPDGASIALRVMIGGEPGIYVTALDRWALRRVGSTPVEHGVPFFSPDGERLLLTPATPEGTRILTMDVATGSVTPVVGACDRSGAALGSSVTHIPPLWPGAR